MNIPDSILQKYQKLMQICAEHPNHIPIDVAAEFHGVDVRTMRRIVNSGNCTYAQCTGQNGTAYSRQFFLLDTFAFYCFETQGMLIKQRDIS